MSQPDAASPAPSRISRLQPTLAAASMGPGTANTSRPWSRAAWAVISAPERTGASTTSAARLSPLMMRLRTGKCPGRGSVPGGYSDSSTPVAAISSYNLRFSAGYTTSTPPPRTAAVKPPACKAPRMAAPSMPLAMPDTTTAPCRASS